MDKFQAKIIKKNMYRTCYASLGASVLILISTIIIQIFNISFFTGNLTMVLGILGIIYFGGYFALSYITIRDKSREYYEKIVNFFWGGFIAIFVVFSMAACTPSISLMICWISIMAFSLIPLYDTRSFVIFLGGNFVLSLVPIIYHAYSYDQIILFLAFNACAVFLSKKLFDEAYTALRYKNTLNNERNYADTDPMTGLLNRRGLDRKLGEIWPYCERQNTEIAVIMLDIDYFKSYNDTFGHPEGDECIKSIAGAISEEVRRKTDLAARVGGEEFLIMLTGIDSAGALRWTASLKKHIEGLKIKHAPGNFLPYVSVSMGLATGEASPTKNIHAFTDEADKALYHAKQNGRACVSFNKRIYGRQHTSPVKTVSQ